MQTSHSTPTDKPEQEQSQVQTPPNDDPVGLTGEANDERSVCPSVCPAVSTFRRTQPVQPRSLAHPSHSPFPHQVNRPLPAKQTSVRAARAQLKAQPQAQASSASPRASQCQCQCPRAGEQHCKQTSKLTSKRFATTMPLKSSTPKWKKFRCPPLSAKRKQQITKEADIACDELLRFSAGEVFSDTGGSDESDDNEIYIPEELKWEYAEQVDSIRVEKVRVRSERKKSVYYFRGITTMESTTLEEIMELYEVDVEHPNVQLETKLSPDMLHSVILYEIKPYNFHDNTVFIGIRWSAVRSPYFLVRNRDYCYLEIQRRFTLPDGRRGFARCLHSVKIKSCPDMEKTHGFVRGSMYRSGLVFIESRRDRRTLDVVQAVYTDLKGNVPQWVAASGLRHRLMSLEHLKKYVTMKRVANQTFARRSQMMAPDKVKTCFVCVDDIGTFQRRYNCQKCGEVMCGRCKMTINAEIPVVGKMKLTICNLCSLAINRTVLPDSGSSADSRAHDGARPFSVTPAPMYRHNECGNNDSEEPFRKRALSLNSFHTANFDQTSIYSSVRSHEI